MPLTLSPAIPLAALALVLITGAGQAQNMALTPERGRSAEERSGEAAHHEWPTPPPRPEVRMPDADLPNQRTGPMHQRVVRDICIGCDR